MVLQDNAKISNICVLSTRNIVHSIAANRPNIRLPNSKVLILFFSINSFLFLRLLVVQVFVYL